MTTYALIKLFKTNEDEYLMFERITNPRSKRPDLNAFMLLDTVLPDELDIISAAEHDEIFLEVSIEELATHANDEQIVELIRCGVRLDSHSESLTMFV